MTAGLPRYRPNAPAVFCCLTRWPRRSSPAAGTQKPRSTRSSRRSSTTTAPCAATWSTKSSCPGARTALLAGRRHRQLASPTPAPRQPASSTPRPVNQLRQSQAVNQLRQPSPPTSFGRPVGLLASPHSPILRTPGADHLVSTPDDPAPQQGTASDGPVHTPRRAVDMPTRRSARHRASPRRAGNPDRASARRFRYLLCGLLLLPVLTAGGLYLARGSSPAPSPVPGRVTALQTPPATCQLPASGTPASGQPQEPQRALQPRVSQPQIPQRRTDCVPGARSTPRSPAFPRALRRTSASTLRNGPPLGSRRRLPRHPLPRRHRLPRPRPIRRAPRLALRLRKCSRSSTRTVRRQACPR